MEQRREIVGHGPAFGSRIRTFGALGILLACVTLWAATTLVERRAGVVPQPVLPSDLVHRNSEAPESILSSGETLRIGGPEEYVQRLQSEEIATRLAWTRGEVRFNGETLSEAVDEFNRYNRLKLKIGDAAIAGLRVNGTFKARDPRTFVAVLERSQAIQARTIEAAGSEPGMISLVAANTTP